MSANEWYFALGEYHCLSLSIGLLVISPAKNNSLEITWRAVSEKFILQQEGTEFENTPEGLEAAKKRAIEWAKELLQEAMDSLGGDDVR
jgi:hypothetical protein